MQCWDGPFDCPKVLSLKQVVFCIKMGSLNYVDGYFSLSQHAFLQYIFCSVCQKVTVKIKVLWYLWLMVLVLSLNNHLKAADVNHQGSGQGCPLQSQTCPPEYLKMASALSNNADSDRYKDYSIWRYPEECETAMINSSNLEIPMKKSCIVVWIRNGSLGVWTHDSRLMWALRCGLVGRSESISVGLEFPIQAYFLVFLLSDHGGYVVSGFPLPLPCLFCHDGL